MQTPYRDLMGAERPVRVKMFPRLSDEKSADLGELTLEQVSQSDRMYKSEWVNELKQRTRDRKVKKME